MLFIKVWQNYSFFLTYANFATFFLCFLRCFIHFTTDLNDFCKECTKKTAAPCEVLLTTGCSSNHSAEQAHT